MKSQPIIFLKEKKIPTKKKKKSVVGFLLGSFLIFPPKPGNVVFAANRFNYDEILMIILAGGVVGLGMALIVQVIGSIVSNKKQ